MSEPNSRRVVVTGLGVVSSIGIGVEPFTESIKAGRSGISPITSFDASGYEKRNAGEVKDFDPSAILERIDPENWGRSGQFAASAARLAVRDAHIDPDLLRASNAGSAMGTASGEPRVMYGIAEQWSRTGGEEFGPGPVGSAPANRLAGAVNSELGLTGEAVTFGTACSASNYTLGYGYDLVRTGEADFFLAGGADSVSRYTHLGFSLIGIISEILRPFDSNRSGIVTAEGGVCIFLEPLEHAVARGARIYAEVLGYGVNCDAKHMTQPDVATITACMQSAHTSAGVKAQEIDYICAHGTGTPASDAAEVAAARAVFGDDVPPISSIKSMLGHTMGAASGLGSVICCKALEEGFLPPTATLNETDPELGPGIDFVPGVAKPANLNIVENHGFAFGGNNAITIFGRVK
ncbi:beta-ketoacyl-[acyl-carrier-protein] synthase family protein [Streptomyces mayteni]